MPRKRPQSARDLVAELAADPAYQARVAAHTAAIDRKMEEFRADAAPLTAELSACGVPMNALETYFADVPRLSSEIVAVLGGHLERHHVPAVFEAIVRSLSRSDAAAALPLLERVFAKESVPERRWLLANAISAMAKLKTVGHLPGIAEYASLFRRVPRKPAHQAPRPNDR